MAQEESSVTDEGQFHGTPPNLEAHRETAFRCMREAVEISSARKILYRRATQRFVTLKLTDEQFRQRELMLTLAAKMLEQELDELMETAVRAWNTFKGG